MTGPPPVEVAWVDAWGRPRRAAPNAVRAVVDAMRLEGTAAGSSGEPVWVGTPGQRVRPAAELITEDGVEIGQVSALPRDLPVGYHTLRRGEERQLLLVAPRRSFLPERLRAWGWAVQLYATRSRDSWGIGDLRDLRRLASWSRRLGAGAMMVNPLAAPNPAPQPEPSPYYPSTRRFRSPLYLALEEVPFYGEMAEVLEPVARQSRAANADRAIDRAAVLAAKRHALERLWAAGAGASLGGEQAAFRLAQGSALRQWGIFAALSERHGPRWTRWPAPLRDPGSRAVAESAGALADRVALHEWVQWLLDRQLAAAAAETALIADLPVGFDPGGFDAWTWQDLLATAHIGAPPDLYNANGQDWGLPPFVPHHLRAAGHRPFIETIRASLAHAGGLRIDHVLGLFRQWWVPAGARAADGAYVRQPSEELLAILAIESSRAGAFLIGEDLGTVQRGVRRRLASANLLSTRLAYFELRPPETWPAQSVGAITNHDLPTIAGLWTGADLADQAAAGVPPDVAGARRLRRRLARFAAVPPDAELESVLLRSHAGLAAAGSALTLATLEDALQVAERPNLPGTTIERKNWSLALPMSLEEVTQSRTVRQLAAAMRRTVVDA